MVCWFRICGAQGYEESHWWLYDNGKRRGVCPIQKNKLSTKSSAEDQLVGVDYLLKHVICNRYFLKEQGWYIHDNVIFRDNQSEKKWRRMTDDQVARRLATSISDIILSLIGSQSRKHLCNSVPLWTWAGITSQKQYRDTNFIVVVISSWVSVKMAFLSIICLEENFLKRQR